MAETRDFQPDVVRRSDHRTLVHQHIDWGLVRADFVKRTGLLRQETRIEAEQHALMINLQGDAKFGEDYVDGRRVAFTPRRPGSVVFLPAHSEWTGWDEGDARGCYLFVSIDATFIEQTLGADNVMGLQPSIGFRDGMIETCLQTIATELKNPDPASVIMVESQVIQMFVQMVRLNGLYLEPAKGGLSPFYLKRVVALIDARLMNPPSLDELAGEIGVSRRHFFRAFKQSTGMTPFAFVADLRLKRAVDLLRATDRSATDIALDCGFASSSHFAYAFKRAYGAGPSEFRRRWRI
ncbi:MULTISPECIES: AraC family transcriptional regulator [unclassified Shinella]|uniref:AraC family transcriptional regulator n=1 Tax=unclassified Shinella TaxID=2643062 RepID=UPI00234F8E51|nr:AraC family transcriptional regulator [Shinella sp. YE25]MDC7259833.1 AraC family transcriptional regulator [Shinella sp. YE25]CAK7261631.1 AraC family transcriptional regulator [Shinella sp. WSC3-e]